MKKTLTALLASACAFGAFAKELVVDNTRYVYEEIADGTVKLAEIAPRIEGPELDLGAVQKLFSANDLQIVGVSDASYLVSDLEAVTSVVLPEYFGDRYQTRDLCDVLPNLESFSGGGALLTLDGLVYADGGRFLIRCPRARAGEVKLPSNCREIMDAAFNSCTNITGVTGGEEVLRVRYESFGSLYDMDGLPPFVANLPDGIVMVGRTVIGWKGDEVPDTIELPAGATSVADSAFPENVTNVVGGANVRWVGDDAFPGLVDASPAGELVTVGKVLLGCNGDIDTLNVPEGVVTIAPKAFNGKSGLTQVTLPDFVEEVGEGAFAGCANLEQFTFGQATESLGFALFASCDNLKDVYFRCDREPANADAELYVDAPLDLVTHVVKGATGWPDDWMWRERDLWADMKRDAVTGYVGYYGKWPLATLGMDVPPAGTVYSAVAYGLPKGLVLKSNTAKKNKKGKVIAPAKTSWWIEGVPTATLDGTNQTAFVKTTVNGFSELHPLAFVVAETPVIDVDTNKYPLAVNTPVVMPASLPEIGKGWTLSGLPPGLKQTKKAVKVKLAGKLRAVQAYGIYGTPTAPGNYVATAKKKDGSCNLMRRLRFQVRDENGELVEDPQDDRMPVKLDLNGGDGANWQFAQGGVRRQPNQPQQIGEEPVVYSFNAPHGATLSLSGAPATLGIAEDPDNPGNWHVVGSAPPGDYLLTVVASQEGSLDARQTLMIHFDALPAWATGSFAGYVTDPENFSYPFGYCTATVGAKGNISGKFVMDGSTYTFSATSYTANNGDSFTADDIPLKTYETQRVYDRKKKKYVSKQVLVDSGLTLDIEVSSGVGGLLTGKVKDDVTGDPVAKLHAPQNLWNTSYKALGTSLFRASAKKPYRTFTLTSGYGIEESGVSSLTFKITPLGVVTVTGAFPYQKRVKKNGRWTTTTAYNKKVASTVLLPDTSPEAGAVGFKGRVAVFMPGYSGIVDFPFPTGGDSWWTGEFNGVAYVKLPNRSYDAGQAEQEWDRVYDRMYGTYNIKVKSSLAFTGTFTPAIGEAKTFSGTFKQKEAEAVGAANAYYYEATSTLLCDGWTIPFRIQIFERAGGVGDISFGSITEDGAVFGSENGLGLPTSILGQDLFLRSDMDMRILKDSGTVWADMSYCQMGNDMLTYRFSSNGRVSISGTVEGHEVQTSAVIQFAPQDDLSTGPYTGCFYFCLDGYGLFVQPCTFDEKVSVESHQLLQYLWAPDNE